MAATMTWLGHATYRLTLRDERVIVIDPWLTENPSCPKHLKKLERCDMILLTHGHFDHVGDVKPLVEAFDPIVVANFELCVTLEKQFGKGRYSGMNTGGTQKVEGVRVSLTQAFHSSGIQTPQGIAYGGMPNGLVVRVDDLACLYDAGDTDVFGDMKLIAKLYEPKIAILPIGDFYTMGAEGAALAAEMIQPEVIIPAHYKTFPILNQSAEKLVSALPDNLKDRVIAPEVGQVLQWTSSGLSR